MAKPITVILCPNVQHAFLQYIKNMFFLHFFSHYIFVEIPRQRDLTATVLPTSESAYNAPDPAQNDSWKPSQAYMKKQQVHVLIIV